MESFYNRFLHSVERFPQHVAAELQPSNPAAPIQSHTYRELREMAESVGRWLREADIRQRSRCAILAANSPRWVAAYLGMLANGCVAVPFDTAFKPEQAAKLLADSGSSVLFTDLKHLGTARAAVAQVATATRIVLLDGRADRLPSLDEMFAARRTGFTPASTTADELAVILYTSGTTSDPKGVMLTHANLAAEANAVFQHLRVDETDAVLGVLPLFHALAQMANLLLPFVVGARVVYLEQLNTTELLRGLKERGITIFACVPQFFYLIHERVMKQIRQRSRLKQLVFRVLFRLSKLGRAAGLNLGRLFFREVHRTLGPKIRFFVTGGSRFDPAIGRDLETLGFDILQAYGLTECCGGATITRPGDRFVGSVGVALPSVAVKVLAPSSEGAGEVAIRGGIVMKGYYNRPGATSEVLKNGWLHTGDLGRLDSNGQLFITGRQKEVIVLSSGKNIHPEEIESHYLQSPWIKEICVLGLRRLGEPASERLHAIIVPDFDVMRQRRVVNAKEVLRFDIESLSVTLPSTKRILSYDIWQQELPRTTTRKLKRFEIQKLVEQQQRPKDDGIAGERELSPEDQAWLEDPTAARVLDVIRSTSKSPKPIHPADNLELDLGLDSMERVELVVALEQALAAKADENMISEVYTVRELVEAVRAGTGKATGNVRSGWKEVFAQPITDPEVLAVGEHHPLYSRSWNLIGWFVRFMANVFCRLELNGLENLPAKGPYIICPNHQSYIDAPVLVAQFPYRLQKECFYVGTSDIFGSGFMRWIAKTIKLIPVDPDANLVPAMRAGAYGLDRGKILVLYPEGERSIDGEPKIFKKGAAILSVHRNVPIVPVAMEGLHDMWPRGRSFQGFRKLRISIGRPLSPPPQPESLDAAYESVTTQLRGKVIEMWRPLATANKHLEFSKIQ